MLLTTECTPETEEERRRGSTGRRRARSARRELSDGPRRDARAERTRPPTSASFRGSRGSRDWRWRWDLNSIRGLSRVRTRSQKQALTSYFDLTRLRRTASLLTEVWANCGQNAPRRRRTVHHDSHGRAQGQVRQRPRRSSTRHSCPWPFQRSLPRSSARRRRAARSTGSGTAASMQTVIERKNADLSTARFRRAETDVTRLRPHAALPSQRPVRPS